MMPNTMAQSTAAAIRTIVVVSISVLLSLKTVHQSMFPARNTSGAGQRSSRIFAAPPEDPRRPHYLALVRRR